MPNTIVWDKEMRAIAEADDMALFAYGYDTRAGKFVAHTPTLTDGEAASLVTFLIRLTSSKKPLAWCVTQLKSDLKNCKKRKGIKDA